MKSFNQKVAAITGAGSGIGQQLAILLAQQGADLALSDVNDQGLAETLSLVKQYPVKVTLTKLDVSHQQAVREWAENSFKDHGKINLIFNNAGVALASTVEGMSYEEMEWIFNINFWGVVYGTKEFLPYLKQFFLSLSFAQHQHQFLCFLAYVLSYAQRNPIYLMSFPC